VLEWERMGMVGNDEKENKKKVKKREREKKEKRWNHLAVDEEIGIHG